MEEGVPLIRQQLPARSMPRLVVGTLLVTATLLAAVGTVGMTRSGPSPAEKGIKRWFKWVDAMEAGPGRSTEWMHNVMTEDATWDMKFTPQEVVTKSLEGFAQAVQGWYAAVPDAKFTVTRNTVLSSHQFLTTFEWYGHCVLNDKSVVTHNAGIVTVADNGKWTRMDMWSDFGHFFDVCPVPDPVKGDL
eukprot:Hpha_TRINITY_DN5725_c0_g1::TRINITY_DN5725_c0_g1_i1::g.147470::m.147470